MATYCTLVWCSSLLSSTLSLPSFIFAFAFWLLGFLLSHHVVFLHPRVNHPESTFDPSRPTHSLANSLLCHNIGHLFLLLLKQPCSLVDPALKAWPMVITRVEWASAMTRLNNAFCLTKFWQFYCCITIGENSTINLNITQWYNAYQKTLICTINSFRCIQCDFMLNLASSYFQHHQKPQVYTLFDLLPLFPIRHINSIWYSLCLLAGSLQFLVHLHNCIWLSDKGVLKWFNHQKTLITKFCQRDTRK